MNEVILTTKGKYKMKNVLILGLIWIPCGLLAFSIDDGTSVGWILSIVVACFFALPMFNGINMKNSYVEVCRECIRGRSMPQSILSSQGSVDFSLRYEEILNIDIDPANNTFKIYHQGGTYNVQAFKMANDVVKTIREQQALFETQG